ncbi:MAG: hypothetical protein ACI8UO_000696 [Verrucomicrobiales bacterium]|jgi:hypothetical protein
MGKVVVASSRHWPLSEDARRLEATATEPQSNNTQELHAAEF